MEPHEAAERYSYRVQWSEDDQEHIGKCDEMPTLTWSDQDMLNTLHGIRNLVTEALADRQRQGGELPKPNERGAEPATVGRAGIIDWPRDSNGRVNVDAAIVELARLLPSLHQISTEPWNPARILVWACGGDRLVSAQELVRAVNVRRGLRRKDERPPEDHWAVRDEKYEQELLSKYYDFKGWNHEGIPTRKSLERLDLAYVADDLEQRGILTVAGNSPASEPAAELAKV